MHVFPAALSMARQVGSSKRFENSGKATLSVGATKQQDNGIQIYATGKWMAAAVHLIVRIPMTLDILTKRVRLESHGTMFSICISILSAQKHANIHNHFSYLFVCFDMLYYYFSSVL